jgi:phenylacetate-CoA ligase
MLYPFQKETIERVFGCRVFSHYGHYEMAALAGFCEHNDFYHVLPQYGFVELIDKNEKKITESGQTGEIVATSFIMEKTPFIRYKTGDLAVLKGNECLDCGRPYQVWEKVIGRRQEMIVSANGRLISMTMLNMHDDIYQHLRQYQFVQNEKGKVILKVIPQKTYTFEEGVNIKERLKIKLGDDIELEIQTVSEIEFTKRGKHKALIQNIKMDETILTLD